MGARSEFLYALHRIVIPRSYARSLLSELSFYGINSVTLFPDLDGLSAFLNWSIEQREYWSIIQKEEPE